MNLNRRSTTVMLTRIAAILVGAALALVGLAAAPANAATEVGSLYAFSVQPTDCNTPGHVHINYVEGVTWYLGGQPVNVSYPSSDFPFPGGFQDDVYAVPQDGYQITSDVQGTQDRPFWLTVNAAPNCTTVTPPPTTTPVVKKHKHPRRWAWRHNHRHHR